MGLITFLSDFGNTDHYVAAVKARIFSINPGIPVIDISHDIEACNLAHAAFVSRAVYKDFPKGSVHLIGVNSVVASPDGYIAVNINDHFFISADNGLMGLISDEISSQVVNINSIDPVVTTFPARDILAPAAARLASGTSLSDLGKPVEEYRRMLARTLKATKSQITGHVIRVDHFGNLITNIDQNVFNDLSKDKKYSITFGREQFERIHDHYLNVESGDCFIIFNSLGLMEIGINQGNASELLNLHYDSPVIINFEN